MTSTAYRIFSIAFAAVILMACSEDKADSQAKQKNATLGLTAATEPVADIPQPKAEDIFNINCLACHAAGPGHPGTMRLAIRLGADKSVLTERNDLHPEYIKTIVRQGILLMPPFRSSEITDSELDALAAYLARADS